MSIKSTKLPRGFQSVAGRVQAPRAEAPGDPEKKPDAAEPRRCPSCEAEVPPDAKFCPACGAELPEPEGEEKKPAPEPAPAEAKAFARHALAITKARSLDGARGTIAAWRELAGKASAVSAELQEKSARLATIERERLLERAVAEGRLDPSEAWAFSVDEKGKKVRAFSAWAGPPDPARGTGQSLEQLASFIEERPAAARTRTFTPAKKEAPAAAPPAGVNPDIYAAASRQVAEQLG